MRELTLVLSFLCAMNVAYQEPIEQLEQVLVYPVEPATKKIKRETSKSKQKEFKEFVEDKLIQHTQALEHLVELVESNEEITKQLVEVLSHNIESPNLPEKIEVYKSTRRSGVSEAGNPIVGFTKKIPKYGVLLKDIILAEFQTDAEPKAVVEKYSKS